jgi:tetratricopeptide (TPR) repeat protein
MMLGESIDLGLGAQTDVYSMGVVLFELFSGCLPYQPLELPDRKQVARDLLIQQKANYPSLLKLNPLLPRSIATMIESCLAYDSRLRPTAGSLHDAFCRYQRRGPHLRKVISLLILLSIASIPLWGWLSAPKSQVDASSPTIEASMPPPSSADGFFDRGVRYLQSGDLAPAMKDFLNSRQIQPDGRNTAYLAYCYNRTGNPSAAASLYQEAISRFGFETPWVHNNLSFSLIEPSSPKKLRMAIEEAKIALLMKPNMRESRLNRLYASFLLNLDPATQTISHAEECLADLDAVMAHGPYNVDLYYKAGIILAASSGVKSNGRAEQAVQYLKEAILRGKKYSSFSQNPIIQGHLASRGDFKELANVLVPSKVEPTSNLHIIDPSIP